MSPKADADQSRIGIHSAFPEVPPLVDPASFSVGHGNNWKNVIVRHRPESKKLKKKKNQFQCVIVLSKAPLLKGYVCENREETQIRSEWEIQIINVSRTERGALKGFFCPQT